MIDLPHIFSMILLNQAQAVLDSHRRKGMYEAELIAAARKGDATQIRHYLARGANINTVSSQHSNKTPIHLVMETGNQDAVKALLEGGANIEAKDGWGNNALYCAAFFGLLEIAKLLLQKGANANNKSTGDGLTPAEVAKKHGFHPLADLIKMEEKDQNGNTHLHNAVLQDNVALAKSLLAKGANVHAKSNSGQTPVFYAKNKEILELLLKYGTDINAQDKDGLTALHQATAHSNTEHVRLLLTHGADTNARIRGKEATPIFYAHTKGKIGLLTHHGADVNAKVMLGNNTSYTALHQAVDREREIGRGWTKESLEEEILFLLAFGANINEDRNTHGTPLNTAAYGNLPISATLLLECGADRTKKNIEGKTPAQFAMDPVGPSHDAKMRMVSIISNTRVNLARLEAAKAEAANMRKGFQVESIQPKAPEIPLTSVPTPPASAKDPSGVVRVSFSIPYEELKFGPLKGVGGFGEVYEGTWRDHIAVAIKKLRVTTFSAEVLEEFQHEIDVMARLRSPQIVQLYGACMQEPYCIVMEYMVKGSLFHVLRAERLNWTQKEQIALDMSCGLAFLHHENILHRDMKSLNVLIDNQLRAKLSDFGLAKLKENSLTSVKGSPAGTILWMAPELFKPRALCTKGSDVYSLGVTLWELASGKIPSVQGRTNEESDAEKIPSDTPPAIAKLITFCWDAQVEKRPTANRAVEILKEARAGLK
jgi:ankyrin repeat protein